MRVTKCLFFLLGLSLYLGEISTLTAADVKETTPDDNTVLEQQASNAKKAANTPGIISLYRPNYVIPFYNTGSPYQFIYLGQTPNNQRIKKDEFKTQFSFLAPIIRGNLFTKPSVFNVAYTQLMYWQVYAKSQYFRETNYEPELFIQSMLNSYSALQVGINHQSNGRGGNLERSWNRAYGQLAFSGQNWYVQARGWGLVAESESSDLHNPEIAHYLGYENILISYNIYKLNLSAQVQNIESGLKRGFVMATVSYPLFNTLSIYAQFFNGYGQSLIEYNHKTTSGGIGVSLNDWIN